MGDLDSYYQTMIGKKIKRDILSDSGVLLVANSTIITYEHLEKIGKHGIILNNDDVSAVGPYIEEKAYQHSKDIDEMVLQLSGFFEEVRETRRIPLSELRKDVLPLIHTITDGTQLLGLFASLQAKDDYTYRHNIAVGALASLIGIWMELEQHELMQLTTAALLHDIGKVLIPKNILNKPSKLTEQEYNVIKKHTVYGYEIMKENIGLNHRQALVALQHHERMDGSGYPLGLKKDRIDLFSRIVAVADIFHAMTSTRVYRDPSPFYEVLFEMEKNAFGQLDPTVTRLFMSKTMTGLIGHAVLLTDGREGTILMVNPNDPTHPLIQVGNDFIDLSKNFSINIKQIH